MAKNEETFTPFSKTTAGTPNLTEKSRPNSDVPGGDEAKTTGMTKKKM
ncbi:MAG: hypothetical protein HQK98_12295 [Nitrospirae bacterium]|nr:hypothetical protein [Nitrospirota bacterium]